MTINHMTQNSCNLNNTANSDQLRSIENTIQIQLKVGDSPKRQISPIRVKKNTFKIKKKKKTEVIFRPQSNVSKWTLNSEELLDTPGEYF